MLVLLAGIFVVHIATVIMLFVSTISNVWLQGQQGGSRGIWFQCNNSECSSIMNTMSEGDQPSMKAVEAFMVLAIIFSCFALCAFIGQLFTLDKGKRFYITGALMLVCWLCVLIGVSIYTARFSRADGFYHGYCFILAWICFCLSLLVAILYFVLRKK
ncbi:epithelial membrane protein 1 [Spea bombifrons]|uniref:epithelial membrane protein 1 n=1 Tax=Spea bombifrons TaxID=233779 RepID=UPI00234A8AD5|nr:epithelial membrane protein 1 [Spea bombifrons]